MELNENQVGILLKGAAKIRYDQQVFEAKIRGVEVKHDPNTVSYTHLTLPTICSV